MIKGFVLFSAIIALAGCQDQHDMAPGPEGNEDELPTLVETEKEKDEKPKFFTFKVM